MSEAGKKVGIIDYGLGNLQSVYNAVVKVGGNPIVSSDEYELQSCNKIILPGVGAFPRGMSELKARKLDVVINRLVAQNKAILGICLGMQLLCKRGYEFGAHDGLDLVDGEVKLLDHDPEQKPKRLPHVGWRQLEFVNCSEFAWLFDGIERNARFYFIHSYGIAASSRHNIASAEYSGLKFGAAIGRKSVIGTQFHPEKSGNSGLRLLSNYLDRT